MEYFSKRIIAEKPIEQLTIFKKHIKLMILNPFWTQVIIKTTLRQKRNKDGKEKSYSDYELAKGYREFIFTFKRKIPRRHLRYLIHYRDK